MKTLREQLLDRIQALGGETPKFYESYSDYDVLEDFENLLRNEIETKMEKKYNNDEDEEIIE